MKARRWFFYGLAVFGLIAVALLIPVGLIPLLPFLVLHFIRVRDTGAKERVKDSELYRLLYEG